MSSAVLMAGLSDADSPAAARIGPNAVLRVGEALEDIGDGGALRRSIFEAAGLGRYLVAPPMVMVDEREVIALHDALRRCLDEETAERIAERAGELTSDYLLAHRIPPLARRLLPALPRAASSRLLLAAMARNAWTFVGSGAFSYETGRPVRLMIADCPLCRNQESRRPRCTYYAATFRGLLRALVAPRAEVLHERCRATGDAGCVMKVRW
jgi:divinyl protochlorophyllide a 8-vinyl-reductase